MRVSLVDKDGVHIAGKKTNGERARSIPVTVNDEIVGSLLVVPQREFTDKIDENFVFQQQRSSLYIAGAALLFAALAAAILARQLTGPIRSLAAGTKSISSGDYGVRIDSNRSDELGRLATDFNTLAETLEKNRTSRKRWVADIAHELRTPLAILRGELDAIQDGVRTYDASTQSSLQAEVKRLSKLVGDLHELSVYDEAGEDSYDGYVDITHLLADVLQSSSNRLEDSDLRLQFENSSDTITVHGNSKKLGQVFFEPDGKRHSVH